VAPVALAAPEVPEALVVAAEAVAAAVVAAAVVVVVAEEAAAAVVAPGRSLQTAPCARSAFGRRQSAPM